LRSTPPSRGIPIKETIERFLCSKPTIMKAILDGQLPAGMGTYGRWNWPRILISPAHAEKLFGPRASLLNIPDGAPLTELVQKCAPAVRQSAYKWIKWEEHPGLDWDDRERRGVEPARRIRSETGVYALKDGRQRRGPIVSRDDFETVLGVFLDPCHKRFGANPGEFIGGDGIFQHDSGSLYHPAAYLIRHPSKFGPVAHSTLQDNAGRLDRLVVRFPTKGANIRGKWTLAVYSADSILRLKLRRQGKALGGEWLAPGTLWQDGEGIWYSSRDLAEKLSRKWSVSFDEALSIVGNMRAQGLLTKFKYVPSGRQTKIGGAKSAGSDPIVHHQSECDPLLRQKMKPGPKGQPDVDKLCFELRERVKNANDPMTYRGAITEVECQYPGSLGDGQSKFPSKKSHLKNRANRHARNSQ
jgi:hypothetical protein